MTPDKARKVLDELRDALDSTTDKQRRQRLDQCILIMREEVEPAEPQKLWLWKNFVDGKQEYWAFDNLYPVRMDGGDPQTLGEPCGYALFKPSRNGRPDGPAPKAVEPISDAEIIEIWENMPALRNGVDAQILWFARALLEKAR